MEDWQTIAQIAKGLGLGETTVRRYTKLFDEYLPSQKMGRATKYNKEGQKILENIAELYSQGYGTVEIEGFLSKQYSKTFDITNSGGEVAQAGGGGSGGKMEVMQKLSMITQVIERQQNEIEALREELKSTKKQMAGVIEDKDKLLIEKVKGLLDKKEKERQQLPWWKRIFKGI